MKGASFQPLPVSGVDDRKDDGKNSHETEFATVWQMVMQNFQTFTAHEFYSLTKGLDLDPQEVKALTQNHIRKALRQGTIVPLKSCYPEPTFQVV